jgi:tetratricopeptide (TPR) repeat protein
VENKPTPEQVWLGNMRAGKKYFQQGQLGAAALVFSRAAEVFPQRVESWVNLGSALLESGRYDDALVAVERALSLQPKLMVPYLILGDALRQLGRWSEALSSYREAVSLQRTPLSLNKLACALRVEKRLIEAEGLYLEAMDMDTNFILARVNIATLQIELGLYEKAREQLTALALSSLPPLERREVDSAQCAVSEYLRLNEAITELNEKGALDPLETTLRNTPGQILRVDENIIGPIKLYADSAKRLTIPASPKLIDLPEEWPLIEAMFMIPYVNSISEYLETNASLEQGLQATGDLLESTNMESAILAARSTRHEVQDPVKAELHLRHWHALACREINGFMPGHFKYTQNWAASDPTVQRVDPARASGTFRLFISDFYQDIPPGLARSAVVCMAICDLHAFADGNGRIGITWLNRELEWAGLAPALFSRELGIKGKLGDARREVRNKGGDLSPLLSVIAEAQQYGLEFCSQLAAHRDR